MLTRMSPSVSVNAFVIAASQPTNPFSCASFNGKDDPTKATVGNSKTNDAIVFIGNENVACRKISVRYVALRCEGECLKQRFPDLFVEVLPGHLPNAVEVFFKGESVHLSKSDISLLRPFCAARIYEADNARMVKLGKCSAFAIPDFCDHCEIAVSL